MHMPHGCGDLTCCSLLVQSLDSNTPLINSVTYCSSFLILFSIPEIVRSDFCVISNSWVKRIKQHLSNLLVKSQRQPPGTTFLQIDTAPKQSPRLSPGSIHNTCTCMQMISDDDQQASVWLVSAAHTRTEILRRLIWRTKVCHFDWQWSCVKVRVTLYDLSTLTSHTWR